MTSIKHFYKQAYHQIIIMTFGGGGAILMFEA